MNPENTTALSKYVKAVDSFPAREYSILFGLKIYLKCAVGEYLTDDQIQSICDILQELRMRPKEGKFPFHSCKVISNKGTLASRFIPRKTLRKDELAILLYNVSPYALLNRRESSMMAKALFPAFFSSSATVYSTFTKYLNAPVTDTGNNLYLSITNLPFHSTVKLEEELIKLGVEYNKV